MSSDVRVRCYLYTSTEKVSAGAPVRASKSPSSTSITVNMDGRYLVHERQREVMVKKDGEKDGEKQQQEKNVVREAGRRLHRLASKHI